MFRVPPATGFVVGEQHVHYKVECPSRTSVEAVGPTPSRGLVGLVAGGPGARTSLGLGCRPTTSLAARGRLAATAGTRVSSSGHGYAVGPRTSTTDAPRTSSPAAVTRGLIVTSSSVTFAGLCTSP